MLKSGLQVSFCLNALAIALSPPTAPAQPVAPVVPAYCGFRKRPLLIGEVGLFICHGGGKAPGVLRFQFGNLFQQRVNVFSELLYFAA